MNFSNSYKCYQVHFICLSLTLDDLRIRIKSLGDPN